MFAVLVMELMAIAAAAAAAMALWHLCRGSCWTYNLFMQQDAFH
jgi:hypothetical protein